MKQKLLNNFRLRALMLVALLCSAFAGAWADEVTFTAGTNRGDTSVTIKGITVSMSTMSRGDNYRCYSGSDMTISSTAGNITNVAITCTASGTLSYGPGKFSLKSGSAGTYSYSGKVGTWTGDAKSFTLSASAQVRITSIVVTYTAAEAAALTSISLSGEYPTVFHQGDEFSSDGIVVTANYDDETSKDVTDEASFTGYDMSTIGEQTVTVSYTENDVTKTADYNITVNAPATLTSISLSGDYPTEFTQGDAFSSEGIVVTANYDDATTKDVTDEASFTGYDMNTVGQQTVTVSYEDKTANYTITVNEFVLPSQLDIDFESDLATYTYWTFDNIGTINTAITAHGGDKYGANINSNGNGVSNATITTNVKVNPGTLTFYISKVSNNTTSSSWSILVSSDGSEWTEASSASATNMSKGSWDEVSTDLSAYSDVYVRISYDGSSAIRTIDDISLVMAEPKVLSSISLSGEYPTAFHQGDAFSSEGIVVTANYEDETSAEVTDKASFSGYDMSTLGEQTVTVSYTENEVTKTADYIITVNAPATLTSISLSGDYPTEFEQGDAFSSEGIIVTANYDDETSSDVTSEASFSGYDMSTLGEQTVTVSYEDKSTTYNITVVEKKGTEENPYTVAQALENTPASGTSADVYVRGIVSRFYNTDVVTDYNNRYYISDDGTETDELLVYKGNGLGNVAFSSADDLQIGDIVVIKGGLTTYNSTKEFASGNYIVTLIRKAATPTFDPESGAVASGTEVTISTTTEGATIYYTTDGTEPTTESAVYEGPISITEAVTIKAIAVNDGYTDSDVATAEYTISVEPYITVDTTPIEIASAGGEGTIEVTYNNFGEIAADIVFYEANGVTTATYDWIAAVINEQTNNVDYVVEANTGEARTAYLKVCALDAETNVVYSDLITITQARNVVYYALVAESNGTYYAVNSSFTSKSYGATEVAAVNGKVITPQTDELSWDITTYGNGYGLQSKATNYYIGVTGSKTDMSQSSTIVQWLLDTDNGGYYIGSRYLLYSVSGECFKNYASSNVGTSSYSSATSAYTFADGYTRTVTAGNFGTICLPYDVAADDYAGVTFYEIASKKTVDNAIQYITLREVAQLEAGVAYLFQAEEEATQLVAAYSGEEALEPIEAGDSGTGLTGTYEAEYIPVSKFILKNGVIYYVDQANYVKTGANKAYIDLTEVPEEGEASVKGIRIYSENGIATGINSIAAEAAQGNTYNLAGQRVSKATKGLYIVNGKKTLVK